MKNINENVINEGIGGFLKIVDVLFKISITISTLHSLYKLMLDNNIKVDEPDLESPCETSKIKKILKKFSNVLNLIKRCVSNDYLKFKVLLEAAYNIILKYKGNNTLNYEDLITLLDIFLEILILAEKNISNSKEQQEVNDLKEYINNAKKNNNKELTESNSNNLSSYIKQQIL